VLSGASSAPTIYADGVAQVAMGYPLSRVILHTVTASESLAEGAPEQRKAEVTIVMPTATLLEACNLLLQVARTNESELVALGDQGGDRLREQLVAAPVPPAQRV